MTYHVKNVKNQGRTYDLKYNWQVELLNVKMEKIVNDDFKCSKCGKKMQVLISKEDDYLSYEQLNCQSCHTMIREFQKSAQPKVERIVR